MYGRQAAEALQTLPLGYLPIGCLERHGDHLNMGHDAFKAHYICCRIARRIGGVVFPPHYYAGVHGLSAKEENRYVKQWGNLYTDTSAEFHLLDIVQQLALIGVRVLVLYSGHYPPMQRDMVRSVAEKSNRTKEIFVIPLTEHDMLGQRGHANIHETSFMQYLNTTHTRMHHIHKANYQDHGWTEEDDPRKATAAKGKRDVETIIVIVKDKIKKSGRIRLH
jgi:creatinine amidohydrolase